MRDNYPICYKAVRQYEGGNDDDPQDPGGRTSRGIIQREWDRYRQTHPGRPADVWKAPEADIAAIYKVDYWDVQGCDLFFSGLDETQFDYGVNSGTGRAPKVLRRCLHLPDNAPRKDVDVALAKLTPSQQKILIQAIWDERLAFLQSLKTWPRFGKGWRARCVSGRALSLRLNSAASSSVVIPPMAVPTETSAKGQHEEPTGVKTAVKTAGGASIVGSLATWIQNHPIEMMLIAVGLAAVIFAIITSINR